MQTPLHCSFRLMGTFLTGQSIEMDLLWKKMNSCESYMRFTSYRAAVKINSKCVSSPSEISSALAGSEKARAGVAHVKHLNKKKTCSCLHKVKWVSPPGSKIIKISPKFLPRICTSLWPGSIPASAGRQAGRLGGWVASGSHISKKVELERMFDLFQQRVWKVIQICQRGVGWPRAKVASKLRVEVGGWVGDWGWRWRWGGWVGVWGWRREADRFL